MYKTSPRFTDERDFLCDTDAERQPDGTWNVTSFDGSVNITNVFAPNVDSAKSEAWIEYLCAIDENYTIEWSKTVNPNLL